MHAGLLRAAAVVLVAGAIAFALAIPDICVGSTGGSARAQALLSCLHLDNRLPLRVTIVLVGLGVGLIVFAFSFDRSRTIRS